MTELTIAECATNPFTGEPAHVREATVWSVDPERGDLYAVTLKESDYVVRLIESGLWNKPQAARGEIMYAMFSLDSSIVALKMKEGGAWIRCQRLRK